MFLLKITQLIFIPENEPHNSPISSENLNSSQFEAPGLFKPDL